MPRQDINLLPPSMRANRDSMSLSRLSVYMVLVVISMLAVYAYQWQLIYQQRQLLVQQQDSHGLQQQKLDSLQASIPAGEKKRLEQLIEQRKQRLIEIKAKAKEYKSYQLGQRRGFYADLQALENSAQGQVALEQFSILGEQRQIQLLGKALNAAAVPSFLLRLKLQPVMHDIYMDKVNIFVAKKGVAFRVGQLGGGANE